MATTEDSNDALWNQSVCSKSWVEIMDEEEGRCVKSNGNVFSVNSPLLRDSTNIKHASNYPVKEEPIEDESACDISISTETKDIKIQPNEMLPNFSVSYKKTVSETTVHVKENTSIKITTSESSKEFLHEDLSLTSHLNGFKLVSPCKVDHKTPTKTPTKNSVSHFLTRAVGGCSPNHLTKRKLQADDNQDAATDEMLMPSPSKIRKEDTPKKKSVTDTPKEKTGTVKHNLINTPKQGFRTPTKKNALTPKQNTPNLLHFTPQDRLNRKRTREITPAKSSEKKTPRDLETDSEVLARRQKQIDYGKNTIGYDRYRQLVPKEARGKMHPKTPPMHLKFSRRAWDGLIKVWRQRLHFWDPPSEGGGNPECLEDMSDTSSTDGSLPATPVQDRKRQCWTRSSLPRPEPADEEDDNQGCTPLPPEEN